VNRFPVSDPRAHVPPDHSLYLTEGRRVNIQRHGNDVHYRCIQRLSCGCGFEMSSINANVCFEAFADHVKLTCEVIGNDGVERPEDHARIGENGAH
jgi:hypothetical protein